MIARPLVWISRLSFRVGLLVAFSGALCLVMTGCCAVSFRSVRTRLAVALDPGLGQSVLRQRLTPIRDKEVWLAGRVVDPDKPCSSLSGCFEPRGNLCLGLLPNGQPDLWNRICHGEYDQFSGDTDIVFDLILDIRSIQGIVKEIRRVLPSWPGDKVHCEAVPYARRMLPSGEFKQVFRGWREKGDWSIEFNGAPFWTTPSAATESWESLKKSPLVCVRGALVIDNHGEVELHPISKIEFRSPLKGCGSR